MAFLIHNILFITPLFCQFLKPDLVGFMALDRYWELTFHVPVSINQSMPVHHRLSIIFSPYGLSDWILMCIIQSIVALPHRGLPLLPNHMWSRGIFSVIYLYIYKSVHLFLAQLHFISEFQRLKAPKNLSTETFMSLTAMVFLAFQDQKICSSASNCFWVAENWKWWQLWKTFVNQFSLHN